MREVEARVEQDRRALTLLARWIETRGGEGMTFEVVVKELPSESVATFRWRGTSIDSGQVDVERLTELAEAVIEAGGTFAGTIGIANVYDVDGIADLETRYLPEELLPPAQGYSRRMRVGGEFAAVTFVRWSVLGASYEALDAGLAAPAHRSRGPARERGPLPWLASPRTADAVIVDPHPDGWPTEIVLPIT